MGKYYVCMKWFRNNPIGMRTKRMLPTGVARAWDFPKGMKPALTRCSAGRYGIFSVTYAISCQIMNLAHNFLTSYLSKPCTHPRVSSSGNSFSGAGRVCSDSRERAGALSYLTCGQRLSVCIFLVPLAGDPICGDKLPMCNDNGTEDGSIDFRQNRHVETKV